MKRIYYIIPFVLVPVSMIVCDLLDDAQVIKMSPYIAGAVLFLLAFVWGNLTPADSKFDPHITWIMPLSLFATMFVAGFLDQNDLGTRFSFWRGLEVATQEIAMLLYIGMMVIAFVASIKPLRLMRRKNLEEVF